MTDSTLRSSRIARAVEPLEKRAAASEILRGSSGAWWWVVVLALGVGVVVGFVIAAVARWHVRRA
jgi:hypothetical protein